MQEDSINLVNNDLTTKDLLFVHIKKGLSRNVVHTLAVLVSVFLWLSVGKDGGLVVRLVRWLSSERGNCDAT